MIRISLSPSATQRSFTDSNTLSSFPETVNIDLFYRYRRFCWSNSWNSDCIQTVQICDFDESAKALAVRKDRPVYSTKFLTIAEMADKYHVTARSLRFYESRDMLRPQRIDGARYYTATDEINLLIILRGKRLAFTLSELEKVLKHMSRENRASDDFLLRVDRTEIEAKIASLAQRRDQISAALDALERKLETSPPSPDDTVR